MHCILQAAVVLKDSDWTITAMTVVFLYTHMYKVVFYAFAVLYISKQN